MNHATDVVSIYDGYNNTATKLYPTYSLSANTIHIELPQSSQRYVYVGYGSTSSYGNYTLTYSSSDSGNVYLYSLSHEWTALSLCYLYNNIRSFS